MIVIVSRYTRAKKSSMENPDMREWVPNYLCENIRPSPPKDSVMYLRDLIVILDDIVLLLFYSQTFFTGV